MRAALVPVLLFALPALAQEGDWLRRDGAGELVWGTTDQPVAVVARKKDLALPDSGFLGKDSRDKPDDYELPGDYNPAERRYLRYVHGQLVDATLLREGPIDPNPFAAYGVVEWRGPILGPTTEPGYAAFGDATSWVVDGRTVLHWRDRASPREVLVSRAPSPGQYAVRRPSPLAPGRESPQSLKMKGSLKEAAKAVEPALSACLDEAAKPAVATLTLRFDSRGRPARLKVDTDQATPEAVDCFAASLAGLTAMPNSTGDLELTRPR